ncbi:hypothetical protein [Nocardia pseudobrasiliensis]|uniref:Uncharacterized protein n=1 Tax=Nocardia pseudobrasiliensis TaxID=45979 RepID=A0A370I1P8_9NOCA|nr:hypothetical protein [Nocardia pseudobrasiliensis]RDI64647.1 hypothetical protein DFR76_10722 [Nocardia pseudobrasiliensis]
MIAAAKCVKINSGRVIENLQVAASSPEVTGHVADQTSRHTYL